MYNSRLQFFFSCTPSRYTYRPTKRSHACKMKCFFLRITSTLKKNKHNFFVEMHLPVRNFEKKCMQLPIHAPTPQTQRPGIASFPAQKKIQKLEKRKKNRGTSTARKLSSQAQRQGVERVQGKCVCTRGCVCRRCACACARGEGSLRR